jgi:hypothetical protein
MSNGRSSPRVSINQLAAYLVATPAQRRRILHNAKYPATFMVNWYDFAREAIGTFVSGGMTREPIITSEIDRLYSLTPSNDNEESRYRTNAEALESFLDCYDQIETNGLSLVQAPQSAPALAIHGVDISVRPEFLLSGSIRNQDVGGGIKLYFSKADALTQNSAPYISAVVMMHVQDHALPSGYSARHAICQVVDVFARQVHVAPRAVTRRFQDIDAACQEVSTLWPTI